jgi:MFS family permease
MPARFFLLIAAQFASALADNALLIVAIALLEQQGRAAWWAPLLKLAMTLAYVLLAPLAGPLADAVRKARLMMAMNGVKVLGTLGLALGWHPAACFVLVGIGAAAYAPAKYGLVTELVPPSRLVAANGCLEVSVVFAALFGIVLGGGLVSEAWLSLMPTLFDDLPAGPLMPSLIGLLVIYAIAALLNLGVPDSGARYARCEIHPVALWRDFRAANSQLWRDADGGLSLAVTTGFWGVGAVLQFAVLRWAAQGLQLDLAQGSLLQGAVALGVIVGAAIAAWRVPLVRAKQMLGFGVLLGLLVTAVACSASLPAAVPGLVLTGVAGGLLVVPLNALLQHRGHQLLSAGRSIAVQGFNENLSILVMLAVYAALQGLGMPIVPLMCGFGLLIAAGMAALLWRQARREGRGLRPTDA